MSGTIQSVQVAPNNTVFNHTLAANNNSYDAAANVQYPRGWAHYQYNPTCYPAHAIVTFNARQVGTINLPQNIAALNALPSGATYLQQAFNVSAPLRDNGLWVTSPSCLRQCSPRSWRR